MGRRFISLALLVVAGTFGLPAGWCCRVPAGGNEIKAAARSCCGHKAPAEPSPVQPVRSCCCPGDSIVPAKLVVKAPVEDVAAVPLATVGEVGTALASELAAISFTSAADSGPPLRVLQCVWRC